MSTVINYYVGTQEQFTKVSDKAFYTLASDGLLSRCNSSARNYLKGSLSPLNEKIITNIFNNRAKNVTFIYNDNRIYMDIEQIKKTPTVDIRFYNCYVVNNYRKIYSTCKLQIRAFTNSDIEVIRDRYKDIPNVEFFPCTKDAGKIRVNEGGVLPFSCFITELTD